MRRAMIARLRPDYLDPFVGVARLICRADPPSWLAEELWRWNRWLYRDRHVEEMRPTREHMDHQGTPSLFWYTGHRALGLARGPCRFPVPSPRRAAHQRSEFR